MWLLVVLIECFQYPGGSRIFGCTNFMNLLDSNTTNVHMSMLAPSLVNDKISIQTHATPHLKSYNIKFLSNPFLSWPNNMYNGCG